MNPNGGGAVFLKGGTDIKERSAQTKNIEI